METIEWLERLNSPLQPAGSDALPRTREQISTERRDETPKDAPERTIQRKHHDDAERPDDIVLLGSIRELATTNASKRSDSPGEQRIEATARPHGVVVVHRKPKSTQVAVETPREVELREAGFVSDLRRRVNTRRNASGETNEHKDVNREVDDAPKVTNASGAYRPDLHRRVDLLPPTPFNTPFPSPLAVDDEPRRAWGHAPFSTDRSLVLWRERRRTEHEEVTGEETRRVSYHELPSGFPNASIVSLDDEGACERNETHLDEGKSSFTYKREEEPLSERNTHPNKPHQNTSRRMSVNTHAGATAENAPAEVAGVENAVPPEYTPRRYAPLPQRPQIHSIPVAPQLPPQPPANLALRRFFERLDLPVDQLDNVRPTNLDVHRAVLLVRDPDGRELVRPQAIGWFEMKQISALESNQLLREFQQLDQRPRTYRSTTSRAANPARQTQNRVNFRRPYLGVASMATDRFDIFTHTRHPTGVETQRRERDRETLEMQRQALGFSPAHDEEDGARSRPRTTNDETRPLLPKSVTQRQAAAALGTILVVTTLFTTMMLLARVPGARAASSLTQVLEGAPKAGPLRIIFQQFFQTFIFGMRSAAYAVGTQPAGLQRWIDQLMLSLPSFRQQGRVSSIVLSSKTALLVDQGVDETRGEYQKFALLNGAAFFECAGDHLQILPMAAEVTIFPDLSKIGQHAPVMSVPLPKVSVIEERDGQAGRVDAAEYLMKHPEVRNYMSQVYATDGAEALNPGLTYIAEPGSYSITYEQVLGDADRWTDVRDEGLLSTGLTNSETSSIASDASDLEVEVGSSIPIADPGGEPLSVSSDEDFVAFPGAFPLAPLIATNVDLRPRHHDLLSIIPTHLAGTAIYILRYVASLPTVDGGKFALALYILFVDLADFYIPGISKTTELVIPLQTVIEARERISKLYLATCTYLFMICGRDVGYELGLKYDALIHSRGRNAAFDTHRVTLAQEIQTTFTRAVVEGRGNPLLTSRERCWFLATADVIMRKHAEALRKPVDEHHDAIFSAMCRFANNRPEPFPIVPTVGTEVL